MTLLSFRLRRCEPNTYWLIRAINRSAMANALRSIRAKTPGSLFFVFFFFRQTYLIRHVVSSSSTKEKEGGVSKVKVLSLSLSLSTIPLTLCRHRVIDSITRNRRRHRDRQVIVVQIIVSVAVLFWLISCVRPRCVIIVVDGDKGRLHIRQVRWMSINDDLESNNSFSLYCCCSICGFSMRRIPQSSASHVQKDISPRSNPGAFHSFVYNLKNVSMGFFLPWKFLAFVSASATTTTTIQRTLQSVTKNNCW